MSAPVKEDVSITVAHHPPGISVACAKCRKIIAVGYFAIGVDIGGHHYLAGQNPPMTCCGEEKKVPLLYDNEPLAAFAAQGVIDTLNRDGDTSNLRLLEMAQFISTAVH